MSTNFDNGVKSRGVEIFPSVGRDQGLAAWAGTIYFASTSNGSDSNNGLSKTAAKATIQAALDLCVADAGNVVYVENGTYTEDITMSIAGVSLIGESRYGTKIIGATDAVDDFAITGDNCRVSNMSLNCFDSGSDLSTMTINDADGTVISNCYFEQGEYQLEVTDSDQVQVIGCAFDEPSDVTDGAAIYFLDSNQCRVLNCSFYLGDASDGIIHEDADDLEVAFCTGVGTDEAGTAGSGAFILINGTDTSSRIIAHDNNVTLFAAVIAGEAGSTAVTGLSAADMVADTNIETSAGTYMGNSAAGNTTFTDTSL